MQAKTIRHFEREFSYVLRVHGGYNSKVLKSHWPGAEYKEIEILLRPINEDKQRVFWKDLGDLLQRHQPHYFKISAKITLKELIDPKLLQEEVLNRLPEYCEIYLNFGLIYYEEMLAWVNDYNIVYLRSTADSTLLSQLTIYSSLRALNIPLIEDIDGCLEILNSENNIDCLVITCSPRVKLSEEQHKLLIDGLIELKKTTRYPSEIDVRIMTGNQLPISRLCAELNERKNTHQFVARMAMDALRLGKTAPINRYKIMFIGKGGVGKTSSIRNLVGERFEKKHISTKVADAKGQIEIDTFTSENWVKRDLDLSKDFSNTFGNYSKPIIKSEDAEKVFKRESEGNNSLVNISEKEIAGFNEKCQKALKLRQYRKRSKSRVDLRERTNYSSYQKKERKIFTLWDMGGQEVFYTVHHMFLTDNSIYCLAFNAFHVWKNTEGELTDLQFWLHSLALHVTEAPIILVGTHSGQLTPVEIVELSKLLHERIINEFPNLRFVNNVKGQLIYFPLENSEMKPKTFTLKASALFRSGRKSSRKNRPGKKSGIVQLRNAIEVIVSDMGGVFQNYKLDRAPLGWVYFMDYIIQKGQPALRTDGLLKQYLEMGLPKDQFELMLQRYTQNGSVVSFKPSNINSERFGASDALSKILVISPQWIINGIKAIIYDPALHSPREHIEEGSDLLPRLKKFESTGVLTKRTLFDLLKLSESSFTDTDLKFFESFFVSSLLMSDFDFKEVTRREERVEKVYLVPSMLIYTESLNTEPPLTRNHENFFMRYTFPSSFPVGIYERVLCMLLNKSVHFLSSPPEFLKNRAIIPYRGCLIDLIVKPEAKEIEVGVSKKDESIVSELREFLVEALEILIEQFFNKDTQPSLELRAQQPGVEEWRKHDVINATVFLDVFQRYFPVRINVEPKLFEYDVFVAHDWARMSEVRVLASAMKDKGIRIWIDENDMRTNVIADVLRGLKQSRKVLVVLTDTYLERCSNFNTNACKEFNSAVTMKGTENIIIVAMVPELLDRKRWIGTSIGYHTNHMTPVYSFNPESPVIASELYSLIGK